MGSIPDSLFPFYLVTHLDLEYKSLCPHLHSMNDQVKVIYIAIYFKKSIHVAKLVISRQ